MWYKQSATSLQHVPPGAASVWGLPATRRMVPMIPQIGLVTADGGTSVFAEDIRQRLCSSDHHRRQLKYIHELALSETPWEL